MYSFFLCAVLPSVWKPFATFYSYFIFKNTLPEEKNYLMVRCILVNAESHFTGNQQKNPLPSSDDSLTSSAGIRSSFSLHQKHSNTLQCFWKLIKAETAWLRSLKSEKKKTVMDCQTVSENAPWTATLLFCLKKQYICLSIQIKWTAFPASFLPFLKQSVYRVLVFLKTLLQ